MRSVHPPEPSTHTEGSGVAERGGRGQAITAGIPHNSAGQGAEDRDVAEVMQVGGGEASGYPDIHEPTDPRTDSPLAVPGIPDVPAL